ncbi:hypothetical protein [Borrelia sp. RT1S]|uniref:hypothetical protein n=1 Tax=Borrelia sp. RT1S TaxID=2898580 RepID=UPI001E319718|nr:hypothetical protein [Borrelia sp. RT1S]UGQ17878.1 hypothetical protein LSO05_05450 [Borrelia sp. RT1S]
MMVDIETYTLSIGDVITVSDQFASYRFSIIFIVSTGRYLGVHSVLHDFGKGMLLKEYKRNTTFKSILSSLGSVCRVINDFPILNFVFKGKGKEFLTFSRLQYGVCHYLESESIVFYKKLSDLEMVTHKLKTFGNNLVELNLGIRAYNLLYKRRIMKVVHYANKSYSQLII